MAVRVSGSNASTGLSAETLPTPAWPAARFQLCAVITLVIPMSSARSGEASRVVYDIVCKTSGRQGGKTPARAWPSDSAEYSLVACWKGRALTEQLVVDSGVPTAIANQVRTMIARGAFSPGTRLG